MPTMYMPRHFTVDDPAMAGDLMRAHPFAVMIGKDAGGDIFATHLPLVASAGAAGWLLEGHLARANPHWGWMEANPDVLVIFNGPDGYISPNLYANPLSVPTWNYIALHARCTVETVHDEAGKDALLKALIAQHEPAYAAQWRGLPEDFQKKMLAGIVGLRLRVNSMDAKFKLSQNRPATDRENIRAAQSLGNDAQREMVVWMERLGGNS